MKRLFLVFSQSREATLTAYGLLVLRIGVGLLMLLGHGWPKLAGFGTRAGQFPSVFGLDGSVSLALAVFAEFFCSLAIIFGLFTRLAVVPLIVTMLVAALVIHGADPFAKKELALMYLLPYVTLIITGPGRFSLDALLGGRSK
jgi:putative oxidoreductase